MLFKAVLVFVEDQGHTRRSPAIPANGGFLVAYHFPNPAPDMNT